MQSSRLRKQLLSKSWPTPPRKQEAYDEHPKQEGLGAPGRRSRPDPPPSPLAMAPIPVGDVLTLSIADNQLPLDAFDELARTCDLAAGWREKASLLWYLGLRQADMTKLGRREYMCLFGVKTSTLQSRMRFLRDTVGLDMQQLKTVLRRWPTGMTYTLGHWRSHCDYFHALGVPSSALPQMVVKAPQLFAGLSLRETLQPRVQHLLDAVGISPSVLPKVLQRGAMILSLPEDIVSDRLTLFLEYGLSRSAIARMVEQHPLVLVYSESKIQQRLEYLSSLGLDKSSVAGIVTRLPQVLSLDVARNLAPKVAYLHTHLQGHASMLATYPVYLTLSLQHRIVPRHNFMRHTGVLGQRHREPISISTVLLVGDEKFAVNVAKSTLAKYQDFRGQLRQAL